MPKDQDAPKSVNKQINEELGPMVRASIDNSGRDRVTIVRFDRDEVVDPGQRQIWDAIRQHTDAIGFNNFDTFVQKALCRHPSTPADPEINAAATRGVKWDATKFGTCAGGGIGFTPGTDMYALLKLAAEVFLLLRCGICPKGDCNGTTDVFDIGDSDEATGAIARTLECFLGNDRASYIQGILRNVFSDRQVDRSPFCPVNVGLGPCLMELIWSYWHEEAMLVQTSNALALRFQNVAVRPNDPLADFELDPLRPLSGFLWGYIQDEPNRLSVARRLYEYHHHYGIGLAGKASRRVRPADSRSKFLQAFHDLLRMTDQFYREASDHTVTPDAFPLLIALRDLHLILSEGAHNQFRDLPWTARSEMLVQQWLLSRPEIRDFLRGRLMVPYPEGWMGAVDAMKRLQGWSDTNVIHFNDLARFGERLLLSVRHVRWDVIRDPLAAHEWALSWRPEVQGYIHAYRMATGVTLSDDVVDISSADGPRYQQPSLLLRNRLLQQRRAPALPAGGDSARTRLALPARARLESRQS
jgi:hypothetical protein